jgi:hypothetical protein
MAFRLPRPSGGSAATASSPLDKIYAASQWNLGPSPLTIEDFRQLAAVNPSLTGGQPSEVLPGLFLGGHPARFSLKGGKFPQHPSGHISTKTGAILILNCCAPSSAAPFIGESLSDGVKSPHTELASLVNWAHCRDAKRPAAKVVEELVEHRRMAICNVAMDDLDEYPIEKDLADVCRALGAVLLPLWSRALAQPDSLPGVRGGVLVHCQMGVSRSASSVLAFLLWAFRGLTLDEAMRHTVSRRDCVCPNEGFLHKLKSFESHVRAQDARDA